MTTRRGAAGREATAPGRWVLEIPGFHPCRLNQLIGRHFAVVARLKRRDRDVIAFWARRACVPPAAGKRRVRLTITLGPRQRAGDPDSMWKSLLDACVHCGLLKDDNRQGVELAPVEFVRGPEMGMTIELEDIP